MSASNLESGKYAQPEIDMSRFRPIEVQPNAVAELADKLSEYVVGQDHAAITVARELMRSQSGLNDPTKPRSTLLFAGLTGVGKTEMSEAVARVLYQDEWEKHYKRIDCTQLQEKSTITRLTGASPTYVGYGDAPLITPDFLDQQGGTVITFDEIEKAHPSIWSALLSVTDKATLTAYIEKESPGNNTHANATPLCFNDSIIIFTSNAGASEMQSTRHSRGIGFHTQEKPQQRDIEGAARNGLKKVFGNMPEFLGRIGEDRMIVFNELSPNDYSQIFDNILQGINARIGNNILVTDKVKKRILITAIGDGSYGARDLKMAIEHHIVAPIGELLYANTIGHNTEVLIDDGKNGLQFFEGNEVVKKETSTETAIVVASMHENTAYEILPSTNPSEKKEPVIPKSTVEFQYGESFPIYPYERIKAEEGKPVHSIDLITAKSKKGYIDIHELETTTVNGHENVFLSDNIPYGISITINKLDEVDPSTVRLFYKDREFSGLPFIPIDKEGRVHTSMVISSWREKHGDAQDNCILVFTWDDFKNIKLQIDR